ncbi:hypothetical protein RJ640_000298 [Escallonia rubra]|uniref:C3H1-type domain-containing protein n=1 Tax=Escallonia rubra TaxID=112253 RepID=A0AA88U6R9_9ASTE|nr:hypothetical protein RJ640_000298 [Escallonia rubra]
MDGRGLNWIRRLPVMWWFFVEHFILIFHKIYEQVCKYFLEAVEKKQYGWFWACPNGSKDCIYRHALPPGYVLKSQMKALLEEEADKIPIEDEIENQRAKVTTSTPITTELFFQWKNKKTEEREAGLAAERAERAKNDRMSGRELFLSDASLFVDDIDADASENYHTEEETDKVGPETHVDMFLEVWPCSFTETVKFQVEENSSAAGPSTSTSAAADSQNDEVDDDDDELDMDELDELEASLSRTSIQIREPGIKALS